MIRDITIGQYYPEYSVIHRIDTRVKIILTFVYMVSIFLAVDFFSYFLIFLFLAAVTVASKVPPRFIVRGLKPVFLIIALTFFLNLFMIQGTPVVSFWRFTITQQGIYTACFMALRIIFLIFGCSLLTFTTKPVKLTDGIEALLKPFVRFGLPAHELAMMMTIALRFIPTLLEETDRIMKAQQARGADFDTGSIFRRAKNMVPIFIPLIVGAFRMAADLAMAMEARCYRGGEGRTKMHAFHFGPRDAAAIAVVCVLIALLVLEWFVHAQDLLLRLL